MRTFTAAVLAGACAVFAAAPIMAAPPAGATSCSGCHAESPGVATPAPRINGLDPAVMLKAMQDFRSGARAATVMDRIAKGFSDEEVRAIAAWYAARR